MPRWFVSSMAYALIPLETLQRILKVDDQVNQVLVKVKDGVDPIESMNELSDKFKPYGSVIPSIEGRVVPFAETQTYYNYLVRLVSLIGFSLLAVSLTLQYSSLSLMVTQEIREIGTLKALGATRKNILHAYVLRSLFLGVIGSSIGSLLGVVVANFLTKSFASTSLTLEGMIYAPLTIFELIKENGGILALYGSLWVGLSLILVLP
jgi:ABC-type lipoprotein release transport system permease subunit